MKIDVDFEIFSVLAFYSSILLLKMLIMPAIVARARIAKKVSNSSSGSDSLAHENEQNMNSSKVFANPEDKAFVCGGEISIKQDQSVERFRRAHLNDIENILPFIPLAVFFCFTRPGIDCGRLLFQLFTVSRIGHTIFYCVPALRKAWLRFGCCFVGWAINVYMAYSIFVYNF